ncbi:MAG: hypothetical protein R2883_05590 [Caldisericia bacterium]
MKTFKNIVIVLISIVIFASGCGGKTTETAKSSILSLEILSSTGYHATGKSIIYENLLVVPVYDSVITIDTDDGKPHWRYSTTVDKAWNSTWVAGGNNQFLCGFEADGIEMVVRLSRDKQVLQITKSEVEASVPIWISDRWLRMSKNKFFGDGIDIEIPDSYPEFVHKNGNIFSQTIDGVIQARDLKGQLVWEYETHNENNYFQLFDLSWCLCLMAKNSILTLDYETGAAIWEKGLNPTTMIRDTGDGLIFAENNIIKKIDKEGLVTNEVEMTGKISDIAVADDGYAILKPYRLELYNLDFELDSDRYLNPDIDQVFVLPGGSVCVSGYSQVFFKSRKAGQD